MVIKSSFHFQIISKSSRLVLPEIFCSLNPQELPHRFPQAQSQQSRQVLGERRQARDEAPCSRHHGCSRSSALRDRRRNRATSAEIQVGINLISFQLWTFVSLGLECVVLLAEVLLPVVVGVASPVAPLKGLVGGHIDVLEVVVPCVASVRTRSWNGKRTLGAVREGHGEGRGRPHQ